MRVLIVGGCFTHQHNIPFERLYHQTLLHKFREDGDADIEIKTITYHRLSAVKDKIYEYYKEYPFDLLIFHLRVEPILRHVKLYYKYHDAHNKLHRVINLPFLSRPINEKSHAVSPLVGEHGRRTSKKVKRHGFLQLLNYKAGSAVGNKRRAIIRYEKCVASVMNLCKERSIRFLLLGPASRPVSHFENRLSHEVNDAFKAEAFKEKIDFLQIIGEKTSDNKPMFFDNGFNVSQEGHDEVAEKIFNFLQ